LEAASRNKMASNKEYDHTELMTWVAKINKLTARMMTSHQKGKLRRQHLDAQNLMDALIKGCEQFGVDTIQPYLPHGIRAERSTEEEYDAFKERHNL